MKEIQASFRQRFEKVIEKAKRVFSIEPSYFLHFRNQMEDHGVYFVRAQVFREFGSELTPVYFDVYVAHDRTYAARFEGKTRYGRKVVFQEFYDVVKGENSALRSLVTAEARLRQLKKAYPDIEVAIGAEGLPDMNEDDMYLVQAIGLSQGIEPYPEKLPPSPEELRRMVNRPF